MYRTRRRRQKESKQTQTIGNHPRRSSLQVNLSYTFDLSDSENTDSSQNPVNKNHEIKNTTTTSINNDISRVLANISDKDEALTKNCSRLRDAILNKTRELFDKHNDLCQITTKVMEGQSNSSNRQFKLNRESPILRSSRNCDVIKSSPIKTRAFTKREHVNSLLASCSQSSNNELVHEITNIGSPIICSTFNDHCNIHETCNIRKIVRYLVDVPTKDVNIQTERTDQKFGINIQETPVTSKGRPSVRQIQTCNVVLDRIDGFQLADRSKLVQEISMDLTNVQGDCILNKSQLRNEDFKPIAIAEAGKSCTISKANECEGNLSNKISDVTSSEDIQPNISMHVNTSLSRVSDEDRKSDEQIVQVSSHRNVIIQPDSTNANVIGNNDGTINSTTDCDEFDDDVSLIQRLRNISRKNSDEESVMPTRKSVKESPGVVEGTPFAMTRSMILRTQAKMSSSEDKTKSQCINVSESKHLPAGPSKVIDTVELEKTILLDNTAIQSRNPTAVIIEESSNDESIRTPESNKDDRSIKKLPIGKKKLFTQHDSSGLASFSPISNDVCSPQVSKLKRVKRRRIRRNVAGRIIKPQFAIGKSQRHTLTQVVLTSSSASSQDYEKLRDFEKERKKKRPIKSKKIVVKRQLKPGLLGVINEVRDRSFDGDPQTSRRSSVFQSEKRIPIKRNYGNRRIIIVATGLCNGDKEEVKEAVKKLKGATMEASVTKKTTHVVTTGVRTINLLRGIIRGCWLVKFDWVKESIKAEKWLSAVNFEIDHFSKAVAENRRDRERFGNSYVPDLFATCGLIHIQNETTPPREILKELIKTAGGSIIEEPKKSKIIIGRDGIKENWVLDSITTGELQSIESYKRKK